MYGYIFIKDYYISSTDKKYLVIKKGEKIIKKKLLGNDLRTDLTFIYKGTGINCDNCGFKISNISLEDFDLDFGVYKIYISIERDVFNRYIPLIVKVAEQKNRLKKYYFNKKQENKVLVWKFENLIEMSFIIKRSSKFFRLKKVYDDTKTIVKRIKYLFVNEKYLEIIILLFVIVFFNKLYKKQIWIIGERKDTAQDNGYHLFNYIIFNKPDCNVYYIIENGVKDSKKIPKKYRVNYGSVKHTILLIVSVVSVNSYSERANMYTKEYKQIISVYPNLIKRKKVFLQHGVIATSRVNHSLHKNKTEYDLFMVSSEFEKTHILNEYGYKESEVAVTGLCRWDNLEFNQCDGYILIMPTWRNWINDAEGLFESNFYKKYISILNNESIYELLKINKLKIKFFLHYQFQKLIKNENILYINEYVEVVKQKDDDIQQLIRNSKLLITDYSSVAFDYAFMKKPVIFYQFDYEKFYSKHYNRGVIDHKNDLFGPIVNTEEDLIKYIRNAIDKEFLVDESYLNKSNKFINTRDGDNCKRVYDSILNIIH